MVALVINGRSEDTVSDEEQDKGEAGEEEQDW
jgi:hypothetical protein